MPRARKTQTGAKAMSVQQVPGQQYGKQVEQVALQRAMPAPQVSPVAGTIPSSPGPTPPPVTPSAQGVAPATPAPASAAPPADPMAAFNSLRERVNLLGAPTQRPDEPLTAGLQRGPGPGPTALGMPYGSPLGDTLRRLASDVGDPYFAELAQKANL